MAIHEWLQMQEPYHIGVLNFYQGRTNATMSFEGVFLKINYTCWNKSATLNNVMTSYLISMA